MEYQKRTLYINQLAREISLIGQPFEIFGGLFLRLVLNIPVGSQGVNAAGFPVAGVVDGVSADGLIAAEYSAEKCYFTSSMAKARKDLEHVLRKASVPGKSISSPAARNVLRSLKNLLMT
ncbi:hypothetical protein P0D95_21275 [Pseudomonas sp. CBSPCAW29]|nr:hypothetical protein P0D95_21275 [Pseudomonas sp. CBSPCAW29]